MEVLLSCSRLIKCGCYLTKSHVESLSKRCSLNIFGSVKYFCCTCKLPPSIACFCPVCDVNSECVIWSTARQWSTIASMLVANSALPCNWWHQLTKMQFLTEDQNTGDSYAFFYVSICFSLILLCRICIKEQNLSFECSIYLTFWNMTCIELKLNWSRYPHPSN